MASETQPAPVKDYKEEIHNDWCPGCGDFGVLNAVQMALADLALPPHRVATFSGIGCSGKTSHYVRTYGIHTLHGRVLPFATGAKLANPNLEVIAVGGDGDGYGIGAGHFFNAGRRNTDIAYVVFDNRVYGLTKGQASPTLQLDEQTKSLPTPNINQGVNPIAAALTAGYTWIGRGYSFDIKFLKEQIKEAILHKGAALLNVQQPCPTYNNLHDKAFYTPRVYNMHDEDGYDGVVQDPTDASEIAAKQAEALKKSQIWGDRIPLGLFYKIDLPTFGDRIHKRNPAYPDKAPATEVYWDDDGKPTADIEPFMKGLRVDA